ncbi:MAG: DUF692 family multinuclear iron-containing protein, partial [Porticoccus sp.]
DLFGVIPTLLERDFNLPPVDELLTEVNQIKVIQSAHALVKSNNAVGA